MKGPFVALSTLILLLVAAPVSANGLSQLQATKLCEPDFVPQYSIELVTTFMQGNNLQGPLCLKACKGEFAGCKKTTTSKRKCKDASAKAYWNTASLKCQLVGATKKLCNDATKGELKADRDTWKAAHLSDKANCDAAYQACKAACAP